MRKNIFIVNTTNQGKTVAVGENGFTPIKKYGPGKFESSLAVVKEILNTIPKSADSNENTETVIMYVPGLLKALTSGSAGEYVKTGKLANGTALTQQDREEFAQVMKLYADRLINVSFRDAQYIGDNASLNQLKAIALDTLNKYNPMANQQQSYGQVAPNPAINAGTMKLIEVMDKQIIELMMAGKIDDMNKLVASREALAKSLQGGVVQQETSVVNNTTITQPGQPMATPQFVDDAEKAFTNGISEEGEPDDISDQPVFDQNGQPVTFAESEEEQVSWRG